MSLGELQARSWMASEWASRSILVSFLYASNALLVIVWELYGEAAVR